MAICVFLLLCDYCYIESVHCSVTKIEWNNNIILRFELPKSFVLYVYFFASLLFVFFSYLLDWFTSGQRIRPHLWLIISRVGYIDWKWRPVRDCLQNWLIKCKIDHCKHSCDLILNLWSKFKVKIQWFWSCC